MNQYPQAIYSQVMKPCNTPMDKYEQRRLALKALADELGRGGVAAIAARIGKDASYVSRMLYEPGKAGRKRIGEDMLGLLADAYPNAFGVASRTATDVLSRETVPGYIRFTMMDGQAGGGVGVVNQDYPAVLRELDIAEWQVRSQIGFIPEEGRVQLITVRGDSMFPDIKNGDVVLVDTAYDYFNGDGVYLINLSGYTMIKRLQIMPDGLHIVSTNPKYQTAVVAVGEMDTLHVAGKIVGGALMRRGEEL